jgi:hypothetical protein
MRGADAAGRGQDEGAGSLALLPPSVRGLFGLSSAMFDYVERERDQGQCGDAWLSSAGQL